MTTIAFDGRTLASDGQVSGGYISSYKYKKIFSKNGWLIGAAGRLSECAMFIEWFEKWLHAQEGREQGIKVDPVEPFDREEFTALVISPERECMVFESGRDMFEVEAPFAIGSGSPFAIAAMKAGAGAKKAVEVAIDLDPYSGGEVFCEEVLPYLEELNDDELISVAKAEGFKITKKHKREDILKMFSEDES